MSQTRNFKILVDADACPVVKITETTARKFSVPVTLLYDTNHVINSDYSEIKIIGAGADAVDFALVNICSPGDIVITQDYGVAAMALGKGAQVIHQSGKQFLRENINGLLMDRHLSKEARMSGSKNHVKGPRKRTAEDDKKFRSALEKLLAEKCKDE